MLNDWFEECACLCWTNKSSKEIHPKSSHPFSQERGWTHLFRRKNSIPNPNNQRLSPDTSTTIDLFAANIKVSVAATAVVWAKTELSSNRIEELSSVFYRHLALGKFLHVAPLHGSTRHWTGFGHAVVLAESRYDIFLDTFDWNSTHQRFDCTWVRKQHRRKLVETTWLRKVASEKTFSLCYIYESVGNCSFVIKILLEAESTSAVNRFFG